VGTTIRYKMNIKDRLRWLAGWFKKQDPYVETEEALAKQEVELAAIVKEESQEEKELKEHNSEQLRLLAFYVKSMGRLQNPNYEITGKYSPQWKIGGWGANVYYYRLPNRLVIAYRDSEGRVHFNPSGITGIKV